MIIVCEGEKTERNYFEHFNERYSRIEVKPLFGKCTDPKSIVEFANRMKAKYNLDLENGDGIWCAFDVDENTDHQLRDACELANKYNVSIGLSNPCFELWLLLHFEAITHSLSRTDAFERLKGHVPRYAKNIDIFDDARAGLDDAITRAQQLNEMHTEVTTDLYSCLSNPSSQVYRIIEFIRAMRAREGD